MFTGLVATQGEILAIHRREGDARIGIRPAAPFEDVIQGESVAVNGACLTVEEGDGERFTAFVSAHTLAMTTLKDGRKGQLVNLERALRPVDRMGGHMVSGHVDCVARIVGADGRGSSRVVRVAFPEVLARQVAAQGSVALDGISLTVVACGLDWLEVNLIPETCRRTTAEVWRVGTRVNMETDVLGKYAARQWELRERAAGPSGVTEELLARNGFLDL
ncbi:MAG: riboflavin synthase [Desulfovibrio sp.]|nr:riboflavin synthase [Desulfovibrio sp.]